MIYMEVMDTTKKCIALWCH